MSILHTLPEETREHLHQTALDVAAVYGGQGYYDFLHTVAHMMMPDLGVIIDDFNSIMHDYNMARVKPYYVTVLLLVMAVLVAVLCG